MIDAIFEGTIKGVVIGAAIGLILAGLLKRLLNLKPLSEVLMNTIELYRVI